MADQVTQVQPGSNGDGSGVGNGMIVGIGIVILLILLAIFFLPSLRGTITPGGANAPTDTDGPAQNVPAPANDGASQLDINVQGDLPQMSP